MQPRSRRAPATANSSRACARASRRGVPRTSRPRIALSSAVRQGRRVSACGMYATAPSRRSVPPTVSDPLSGSSSPAMMPSRVLFPEPLGPTTDTNAPGAASKLMSCSTGRDVPLSAYALLRPTTLTAAGASAEPPPLTAVSPCTVRVLSLATPPPYNKKRLPGIPAAWRAWRLVPAPALPGSGSNGRRRDQSPSQPGPSELPRNVCGC